MGHIGPNLNMIFLEWSSSKIMSSDLAVYPRWLPWLLIGYNIKILIKSDGRNFKKLYILEGDHPRTIWTNFNFIPSSCSEEDFQRFPIVQPMRSHGSHLGYTARSLDIILEEDHSRNIIFKFGPIWPISS
jgi:hypothetical protein